MFPAYKAAATLVGEAEGNVKKKLRAWEK